MKVDNSVKNTSAAITSGIARQRSETASATVGNADTGVTQVQISSLSSLGVDSVLANAPVTNPDKVAEIKQAMADGKFTVDAEKIASGLIDSVRQMLGKSGLNA